MLLRNFFILIALFFVSACDGPELPSPFHASDVGARFAGADFKLTDHNGKIRTLSDFRGKVVVLFFGYIHCPDVCPTTMADLAQVMGKLGKDADRVQVLFVTVDPARDSKELLAQYVPAFYPSFLGLCGDAQNTAQVAKSFKVTYQNQLTSTGYNVDHSAGAFLIDTAGAVRLLSPYGQPADWLEQDIRLLLALK